MTYEVATTEITVVDGVEVDLTVRATGDDERKADHVMMDVQERLGIIATAFDTETPPGELDRIPDENVPPMTVAWERIFEAEVSDE